MKHIEIVLLIVIWNVVVFALYGIDKWKAKNNKWRIREKTLLIYPFCMGSIGGILGMLFFRHKTKHMKFRILLPIAFFFNIGVIYIAKRYLQTF